VSTKWGVFVPLVAKHGTKNTGCRSMVTMKIYIYGMEIVRGVH
jgi:hypothetical protein